MHLWPKLFHFLHSYCTLFVFWARPFHIISLPILSLNTLSFTYRSKVSFIWTNLTVPNEPCPSSLNIEYWFIEWFPYYLSSNKCLYLWVSSSNHSRAMTHLMLSWVFIVLHRESREKGVHEKEWSPFKVELNYK